MPNKKTRHLIVILGDQLNMNIASLKDFDPKVDRILMMEVMEEATYVPHHPHKIILIFSAMRHFAEQLQEKKYSVDYIKLDDKDNKQSFTDNVKQWVKAHDPERVIVTEPGEYRVLEAMKSWKKDFNIEVDILEDDRFYCSIDAFKEWAKGRKEWRMEHFYRLMRQRTGVLMEDNKPCEGQYNFDVENRKPPKEGMSFDRRKRVMPDDITTQVIKLVKNKFSKHWGNFDDFYLACDRPKALELLNIFIKEHLPAFGDYQDAMIDGEYALNHSMLSMYLNIGLLNPKEVVDKAEQAYFDGQVSINNAEGFIRQILGWREYVRGVYWVKMPDYKSLNFLNAKNPLPKFYWTGKTDMACMKHAITQSLETATSHHIQRLMVTGNFAMLLGVLPDEICEWYLAIYADAFEWVELPNTLGMAQFADGGLMASKPYAASGNYINKMSDFCKNCQYNVKEKLQDNACPFNDLYWGFLIDNQSKLEKNRRMAFPYKTIGNMSSETRKEYQKKRKTLIKEFCSE